MLGSALHSALSAVSSAGTAIQVYANNLANSQTDGFISSRPVFASQAPQTNDVGRPPSTTHGGRNPRQTGRGVQVAEVAGDFSQGALVATSRPWDLAIEGEGFFILQGPDGQQGFSRDGQFRLNAAGEIVSTTGQRLLGFGLDSNQQVDTSELAAVRIPDQVDASGAHLTALRIERDGTLQGRFDDGSTRAVGRIPLARLANPQGLVRQGSNRLALGRNAGPPTIGSPATSSIVSGARELSHTNLAANLIDMSLASSMIRVNLAVIDTGSELLEELLHLRRSP